MTEKVRIDVVFAPAKNVEPFVLYVPDQSDGDVTVLLSKLEVLKLINSGLNAIIGAERYERTGKTS